MRVTYLGHLILFAIAFLPAERPADLQPRQRPIPRRFELALADTVPAAPAANQQADPPAPPNPAPPSPAPVLKLNAPASLNAGDLAVISIDPASNVQGVVFTVVPLPTLPTNWESRATEAFLTSGLVGGEFTVIAAGSLDGKTAIAQTTIKFLGDNPVPPPLPPGPVPPGPTPPTPTATKLWIVTIDDATARTPALGALLGDVAYWQSITKAGHKWAELDANNPAAAQFADAVKTAGGLPAIVVLDQDTRKLLGAEKLPADKAGVDALVKKYTGAKK